MAKANFVKSARKDVPNTDIKKGESYWWWQLFKRPKQYSRTHPKPWQLTGSAFLSTLYQLQDRQSEMSDDDIMAGIQDFIDEIQSLHDDTESSLENMPEGLQQGDSGQLLQERIDGLSEWINDLDDIESEIQDFTNEFGENGNGEFDDPEPEMPNPADFEHGENGGEYLNAVEQYHDRHAEWTDAKEQWEHDRDEKRDDITSRFRDSSCGL